MPGAPRAVLGDRVRAYGQPASRHEVEAMLRYSLEDGLLFRHSTHQLSDVK